ncbi:MAG: peptidoglycan DD-metalloendopeptidase family protein [Pseudomonadota bacterium]
MKRIVTLLLLTFSVLAGAQENDELAEIKEQQLEQVRERISSLKRSMDESAAQRNAVTKDLQAAEIEIAEKRIRLKEIEKQRDYSRRRRAELQDDLLARRAELDRESEELANQVRAAYMGGGQERLKLLLNQQDPATLGRMLAYYDYLNDHRAGNIEVVTGYIDELALLQGEVLAEEARLSNLAAARYEELSQLDAAQEKRQQLIASLGTRMADESREIEQLAAEEADLTRLINELTTILSDYPIRAENPFSEFRGKLTWPVAGTLLHDFGQPRAGNQVKWNGVVLAAPRGREVRAIYHGRVVFSDWLAGMGLLVIVEHGEGYLTLYGYNETTLKNAGDWVAPGDVIATVGDSGGQSRPALYFELRQGTRPLNPRQWVTRTPGN